jgi:hypothetical protein
MGSCTDLAKGRNWLGLLLLQLLPFGAAAGYAGDRSARLGFRP